MYTYLKYSWLTMFQHWNIQLLLFSRPVDSLQPLGRQHARPPCPSPSPGVCPSSCPLHRWCHPAISSSNTLLKWSEVVQSCPILCDPMDSSLPGSAVHGIFQARILEWGAISFFRGIFPTRGSNPGLLHCRQTLYHLSHQGSLLPWLFPSSRSFLISLLLYIYAYIIFHIVFHYSKLLTTVTCAI